MKRTVLTLTIGIAIASVLGAALPAAAQLTWGMPATNMMQDYQRIMGQFGGGGYGGGLMMGMPRTNIMQDYNRLLPQLQALQAWGHAHGMPYALPGTINGGSNAYGATSYWGDKFDKEFLREQTPIYENNAGHYTLYGNGDTAHEW